MGVNIHSISLLKSLNMMIIISTLLIELLRKLKMKD